MCSSDLFKKENHNQNLDDYFDVAYYSHIFGFRKPDAASFDKLLQTENILANQTLFIDDGEANIEGAKSIGLNTLLITDTITIENSLEQYLLQLN